MLNILSKIFTEASRDINLWLFNPNSDKKRFLWVIFSVALRAMELSKHGFNEMPDFTLGVLQSRFSAKNLEELYKKYEQRYQLSKCEQHQQWYKLSYSGLQAISQFFFLSSQSFTSAWFALVWLIPAPTVTRARIARPGHAGNRCQLQVNFPWR